MPPLWRPHRGMIESSPPCNSGRGHAQWTASFLAHRQLPESAIGSHCAPRISVVDDRQQNSDLGAVTRLAFNLHLASRIPDNGSANRQPEAVSITLCRKKRFLNTRHMFHRNSASRIANDNFQLFL